MGMLFATKLTTSKCSCDLENKVKITKINSIPTPNNVSESLVKIHPLVQKQETGKADFYSHYRMVTLAIRSRSPKSNKLFIMSQ